MSLAHRMNSLNICWSNERWSVRAGLENSVGDIWSQACRLSSPLFGVSVSLVLSLLREGLRPEWRLALGLLCLLNHVWGRARAETSLFLPAVSVPIKQGQRGGAAFIHQSSQSGHLVLSNTAELYRRSVALPTPSQSGGQWCQEELRLAALPACHSSPAHSHHQPSWAESRRAVSKDGAATSSRVVRHCLWGGLMGSSRWQGSCIPSGFMPCIWQHPCFCLLITSYIMNEATGFLWSQSFPFKGRRLGNEHQDRHSELLSQQLRNLLKKLLLPATRSHSISCLAPLV